MIDPIKQWREKRQAQRDAADAEARDRYNERLKERSRFDFVAAGGTEREFEREWPELRLAKLRDATIQAARKRGDK
jgi:hypothetical protein